VEKVLEGFYVAIDSEEFSQSGQTVTTDEV